MIPDEAAWWRETGGARPPSASTLPVDFHCAGYRSGNTGQPVPAPCLPYLQHTRIVLYKVSDSKHCVSGPNITALLLVCRLQNAAAIFR